jgi:hypothetical protein
MMWGFGWLLWELRKCQGSCSRTLGWWHENVVEGYVSIETLRVGSIMGRGLADTNPSKKFIDSQWAHAEEASLKVSLSRDHLTKKDFLFWFKSSLYTGAHPIRPTSFGLVTIRHFNSI